MIDTEALRKKVIDLAIPGKLTEQLPSDGDAEALQVFCRNMFQWKGLVDRTFVQQLPRGVQQGWQRLGHDRIVIYLIRMNLKV